MKKMFIYSFLLSMCIGCESRLISENNGISSNEAQEQDGINTEKYDKSYTPTPFLVQNDKIVQYATIENTDDVDAKNLEKRQSDWLANTPHIDGLGRVQADDDLNYIYNATIINPKRNSKIIGIKFRIFPDTYNRSYESKIKIKIPPGEEGIIKFSVPSSDVMVSIKEVYYVNGLIEKLEDSFPKN